MRRILSLVVVVITLAFAIPNPVSAHKAATGRVTNVTSTSVSVMADELVTLTIDSNTVYRKWITQKPYGEDTHLTAASLRVGRLVSVHRRKDNANVADWIQIATDVPVR